MSNVFPSNLNHSMAHFSAQRVRGAKHRSLRKAEVRHCERSFSETGCRACLIQSNNLKSRSSIFLFKLISSYGSLPCSLFALHNRAYPGAEVPCGQGLQPLQVLPMRGPSAPHTGAESSQLHCSCSPTSSLAIFHLAHRTSQDSLFAPHRRHWGFLAVIPSSHTFQQRKSLLIFHV